MFTTSPSREKAAALLAEEYNNLQYSPMKNCFASPLEDDLFEWDVYLTSTNPEFAGVPFHFVMKFPDNYPAAAPKVFNKSCTIQGWKSEYTVSGVLIQLQRFLFEVSSNDADYETIMHNTKAFKWLSGDLLEVVKPFDFSRNGQLQVKDRLRVVENTMTTPVVQRVSNPWKTPRKLLACHLKKTKRVQRRERFYPLENERVKVIIPFTTNDREEYQLKLEVGEVLIIQRRLTNGVMVNTQNNPWRYPKWILKKNFRKLQALPVEEPQKGDRIRVIESFVTDKQPLSAGDILVITDKDTEGDVMVNNETQSWEQDHWILRKDFRKFMVIEEKLRVRSEHPVRIRAGPGKTNEQVGTLTHGAIVTVQARNGKWIKHSEGWSLFSKRAFTPYTPKSTQLFTSPISESKPKPAAGPVTEPQYAEGDQIMLITNQWVTGTLERYIKKTQRWRVVLSSGEKVKLSSSEFTYYVTPSRSVSTDNTSESGSFTASRSVSTYSTPAPSECGSLSVRKKAYKWRTYVDAPTMVNQEPQKFVTLECCQVVETVNPRSDKVQLVPENTEIEIDCVYKKRAHMISPVQGWFWMSSPEGPLVRSLDYYPHAYESPVDYYSTRRVFQEPRCVVTTAPAVIRQSLSCQSTRLFNLPTGTPLNVKCIYKQRANVHTRVNGIDVYGWCWLSSPKGDLVERPAENPTVVMTCPEVNDEDVESMRHRLYGVQITKSTRVDATTVELEINSHRGGISALKMIRQVNNKPVQLAWKPSYLRYHKNTPVGFRVGYPYSSLCDE